MLLAAPPASASEPLPFSAASSSFSVEEAAAASPPHSCVQALALPAGLPSLSWASDLASDFAGELEAFFLFFLTFARNLSRMAFLVSSAVSSLSFLLLLLFFFFGDEAWDASSALAGGEATSLDFSLCGFLEEAGLPTSLLDFSEPALRARLRLLLFLAPRPLRAPSLLALLPGFRLFALERFRSCFPRRAPLFLLPLLLLIDAFLLALPSD